MSLSRLVYIVITLLITSHLTTSATLPKIQEQVGYSEYEIVQDVVMGYQNDPLLELRCPIELMTIPRSNENATSLRLELLQFIDVIWYKDGLPYTNRENGNMYSAQLDRLKLILLQVSRTDEGNYQCELDYSAVPPRLANKFIKLISWASQYLQYEEPETTGPRPEPTKPKPEASSSGPEPPSPRPEPSLPQPDSNVWLWSIPLVIAVNGVLFIAFRLVQSVMIRDKKTPSTPKSDTTETDEGSISWGKFPAQLYSPNSHSIANTHSTAPVYDQPPSTGTFRPFRTFIDNACISNPSYGFLNPDNNITEWNFPRRNLERLDKIGEGQFGEVWRYIARSKDGTGTIVAVKRLKDYLYASDGDRSELRAEIDIMKAVNQHPNVIKLLHCCIDGVDPILLIMEYAENGTLQTYLRNCRADRKKYPDRRDVTSKELIKFTYHIAKGMEYVASQGIVHRDLASRNILVSRDKICKVADFGFARRLNDESAYVDKSTTPVPVKWMAPEALEENRFTHKSDIFSLAILMWEIVTLGATPYEQLSSESVYKRVTAGGRLDKPAHCKDELFSIMTHCWSHDPALRPTFEEVALKLERLLLSGDDYIVLEQYPENAYYNIVNAAEKEVVQL